jgi:hypothetical protein
MWKSDPILCFSPSSFNLQEAVQEIVVEEEEIIEEPPKVEITVSNHSPYQ